MHLRSVSGPLTIPKCNINASKRFFRSRLVVLEVLNSDQFLLHNIVGNTGCFLNTENTEDTEVFSSPNCNSYVVGGCVKTPHPPTISPQNLVGDYTSDYIPIKFSGLLSEWRIFGRRPNPKSMFFWTRIARIFIVCHVANKDASCIRLIPYIRVRLKTHTKIFFFVLNTNAHELPTNWT